MRALKAILAMLAFFAATQSVHAEPTIQAQAEIAHLIAYMESSGCEFYRNGTWANAAEATAHLKRKHRYLIERNLIRSADDFIIGAATQSSISQQPYQVRCPGQPAVESAPWFRAELDRFRQRAER